jgi:hypothetical protein
LGSKAVSPSHTTEALAQPKDSNIIDYPCCEVNVLKEKINHEFIGTHITTLLSQYIPECTRVAASRQPPLVASASIYNYSINHSSYKRKFSPKLRLNPTVGRQRQVYDFSNKGSAVV